MKAALVDPHEVGLEAQIGDVGIEIAIAIEIAEGDSDATGVTESLTTVDIVAGSATLKATLIDPYEVGFVVVRHPGIEIAIAIEITESDTDAIGVTESLATVGIGAGGAALYGVVRRFFSV